MVVIVCSCPRNNEGKQWHIAARRGEVGDKALQLELFEQALLEIESDPDLVNQVLEITLEDNDHLRVIRYALPVESG